MSLRYGHDLNAGQLAALDTLELAHGYGLTLARDLAENLGLPPRGMGQKLRALEARGLVRRGIAKKRPSMMSDHLYGWEITDRGVQELRDAGR